MYSITNVFLILHTAVFSFILFRHLVCFSRCQKLLDVIGIHKVLKSPVSFAFSVYTTKTQGSDACYTPSVSFEKLFTSAFKLHAILRLDEYMYPLTPLRFSTFLYSLMMVIMRHTT